MQLDLDIEAIRVELERILASKIFSPAQRSRSFLSYVVERSLAGAPPKEYEIAIDVLGRGEDYDPAIDATVRVEAGRLRGRLREYYGTEGAADPIVIEIPKGGYGAVFAARERRTEIQAEWLAGAPGRNGIASLGVEEEAKPVEVEAGAVEVNLEAGSGSMGGGPEDGAGGRRWIWAIAGLGIFAAVLAAAWLRFDGRHGRASGPIRSLAVLPLVNLSGDPGQEYFADGMTDELITELARIPGLRVVSRTSAMQEKGDKKTLSQIAQELDVDAVVEGSVVRSGGRVRVTAQLIRARDDRHLWAQSYEEPMSDVLTLQDEVAREIASQTQAVLAAPDAGGAPAQVDPGAYDSYLRGLYFLHLRDLKKSAEYFRQAISEDPSYAAAYAGLAEALGFEPGLDGRVDAEVQSQAVVAARRAIELDPASGEAYAALGLIEINYTKDWQAAGRDLERGIRLSPGNPLAEMQYSIYLDAVGRPEDAVTHMRRALSLDPLSFYMNRHMGSVLYLARHYDEALFYLHRAEEMEPRKPSLVQIWASRSYEESGRLEEAERADLLALGGTIPEAKLEPLRAAWQRGGWRAYQQARIELLSRQRGDQCASYETGISYLRLGNRDEAARWIARGIDEHCFWGDLIQVDPVVDDLRSDARYPALVSRMHL